MKQQHHKTEKKKKRKKNQKKNAALEGWLFSFFIWVGFVGWVLSPSAARYLSIYIEAPQLPMREEENRHDCSRSSLGCEKCIFLSLKTALLYLFIYF